jgi:hypothetical protein
VKFSITIKQGPETKAHVVGVERLERHVSVSDIRKVIEVEQYLERLTGLRVHINQELDQPAMG